MKRAGWLIFLLLQVTLVLGGSRVDLDRAAKQVQKKVDGRVLGAKTVTESGRTIHVIRVLTPDGRVVHVRVDGESGKILQPPK